METFGPASEGRDNHFNLLRMIAASGVLISHAWPLTLGQGTPEPLYALTGAALGSHCVFLFFAISGFYITRSFDQRRDWKTFLEARLRRLFPALAVALLISCLAGIFLTTAPLAEYATSALRYFLRGLSLEFLVHDLKGVFENNPYPTAVNGSLWTLKHEFFCYMIVLLIGICGAFLKPIVAKGFVILVIALCVAMQFAAQQGVLPDGLNGARARLGLPFAIGAAIYLWRNALPRSWGLWAATIVLAWLAQGSGFHTPALQLTLSYGVLLIGFAKLPILLRYNRLGDYSYGFYIYAFPIQQILAYHGVDSVFANIGWAVPLTLLCSVVSWHLVEKPVLSRRTFHRPSHPLKERAPS